MTNPKDMVEVTEAERIAALARWRCIACGITADIQGDTGCVCKSGLLYRRKDHSTLFKPSLMRAEVVRLQNEIQAVEVNISEVRRILEQDNANVQ